MQQNPLSCTLFGIVASENTMYSDFDKEGKPVNRLMALFGDSHRLYEDMWDTVVNKSGVWSRRMRLGKQHLRPLDEQSLTSRSKLASDASEESSRLDRTEDSSKGIWFNVSFTKFNDPSDGTTAIFCEMKNIHKVVTQEQKLLAARKNEHDLLQSIIPKHIIEHLLEEKLEEKIAARREEASSLDSSTEGQRTPGSQRSDRSPSFSRSVSFVRNCSFSSDNSDRYLNIAAVRMKSDKRVRAMAEHQKDVTVFFADVVGFTQISAVSSPGDVMIMLNSLFTMFDDVTDFHDVYKVETIGDSYMCVTGLDMKQGSDTNLDPSLHANRMVTFAKDILGAARQVSRVFDALTL
uniref:Guanylate cyclase domain-containing protein n=1 Tax=Chloropicon primus TaxID=1764295 RepID=A0A7S2T0J8_9CHLO